MNAFKTAGVCNGFWNFHWENPSLQDPDYTAATNFELIGSFLMLRNANKQKIIKFLKFFFFLALRNMRTLSVRKNIFRELNWRGIELRRFLRNFNDVQKPQQFWKFHTKISIARKWQSPSPFPPFLSYDMPASD